LSGCRAKSGTTATSFSEAVLRRFAFYDWPGNIIELKHLIERAASRSRTSVIRESDIRMPYGDELPGSLREAKQRFMSKLGVKLPLRNTAHFERVRYPAARTAGGGDLEADRPWIGFRRRKSRP
jgi:DNA-binding NtrC family response regulator